MFNPLQITLVIVDNSYGWLIYLAPLISLFLECRKN